MQHCLVCPVCAHSPEEWEGRVGPLRGKEFSLRWKVPSMSLHRTTVRRKYCLWAYWHVFLVFLNKNYQCCKKVVVSNGRAPKPTGISLVLTLHVEPSTYKLGTELKNSSHVWRRMQCITWSSTLPFVSHTHFEKTVQCTSINKLTISDFSEKTPSVKASSASHFTGNLTDWSFPCLK